MNEIDIRTKILERCFDRIPDGVELASGEHANNKLTMERLPLFPDLQEEVMRQLGKLTLRHKPDCLIGVPSGGNWIVKHMRLLLSDVSDNIINSAMMTKNEGKIEFQEGDHEYIAARSDRILLVEDVFNRFTNTKKTIEALEVRIENPNIVGAVAIWDRGQVQGRSLDIPHSSLIQEHIPPMLPEGSAYWNFAEVKAPPQPA